MLTIVVKVDAPAEDAQGVKEDVAILLEPLGDVPGAVRPGRDAGAIPI